MAEEKSLEWLDLPEAIHISPPILLDEQAPRRVPRVGNFTNGYEGSRVLMRGSNSGLEIEGWFKRGKIIVGAIP